MLLNLSIRTGNFPDVLNYSKVAALFKIVDRTNASNYRPFSLCKVLEKVVHFQLYEFLNSNHLISSKQFGFRLKLSTMSALKVTFADEVQLYLGPLQDPVTWYEINYAGTQMTQWDFQNKEKSGWTGNISLRFGSPTALFASQYNLFRTM